MRQPAENLASQLLQPVRFPWLWYFYSTALLWKLYTQTSLILYVLKYFLSLHPQMLSISDFKKITSTCSPPSTSLDFIEQIWFDRRRQREVLYFASFLCCLVTKRRKNEQGLPDVSGTSRPDELLFKPKLSPSIEPILLHEMIFNRSIIKSFWTHSFVAAFLQGRLFQLSLWIRYERNQKVLHPDIQHFQPASRHQQHCAAHAAWRFRAWYCLKTYYARHLNWFICRRQVEIFSRVWTRCELFFLIERAKST